MKVWVDDQRCRGHGVCVTLCPDVFDLTDDGYAEAIASDVPTEFEAATRRPSTAAPNRPSLSNAEAHSDKEIRRTMPKGYVILTEAIKDPEGMKAYGQAAGAAMGGVDVLAVDTAPKVVEGTWHGNQTVVLEFESVDAARAWYQSEAYQEAAKLRQAAADCNVVILSGFGRVAAAFLEGRRLIVSDDSLFFAPSFPVLFAFGGGAVSAGCACGWGLGGASSPVGAHRAGNSSALPGVVT